MSQQLPSPCISICQINPLTHQCTGCYRSRAEIAAWPRMSVDEQAELLAELRLRRTQATGISRRQTRRNKRG